MEAAEQIRLCQQAVAHFNAGELEAAVEQFHPMVEWPDLMDDKLIWGREAVLDYWRRQLVVVIPEIVLLEFVPAGDDLVVVSTQGVLDKDTREPLMAAVEVVYRFRFRDGLIAGMSMHGSVEEAVQAASS